MQQSMLGGKGVETEQETPSTDFLSRSRARSRRESVQEASAMSAAGSLLEQEQVC